MGVASNVTSHADEALQEYLDLLLKPEPAADRRAPADRPYAEPPRPLRVTLPPVAPPRAESPPVVATDALVEAEGVAGPAEESLATVDVDVVAAAPSADPRQPLPGADPLQPAPWADNGRPLWAQQRFEVLLFSVGGLKLAVPLVELGAIHALEGRALTPIFGQIDWFLGMLPLKEYSLRVIDTAKVVMPERYDATMPANYRYIITLNGSDWGLGVDAIHDSRQLLPEAVRWRGARGKRPWLAGTVIEQMCALIDAAQLTWMFHNLDRRRIGKSGGGSARL
jgi:purine-binding chemotaxis protein CheW